MASKAKTQTGRKISKPDKNKEDGNRSETCKQKNKQGGHLHRLRLFSGDRIVRVTGRAGLGPGAGKSTTRIYLNLSILIFIGKEWIS